MPQKNDPAARSLNMFYFANNFPVFWNAFRNASYFVKDEGLLEKTTRY